MYFHLVFSPEAFAVASGRKSTCKLFRQATQPMVLIDHEFVSNSTSPLVFLSGPFHVGTLPLSGKRLTGVFVDTHGCEKPKSKSCANIILCTCEHERK